MGKVGDSLEPSFGIQAEGFIPGHFSPAVPLVMVEQQPGLSGCFRGFFQLPGQLAFQVLPGRPAGFIMVIEPVLEHRLPGQVQKGTEGLQIPGESRQKAAASGAPGFHHLSRQVVPLCQEMEKISLPQVSGKAQLFSGGQHFSRARARCLVRSGWAWALARQWITGSRRRFRRTDKRANRRKSAVWFWLMAVLLSFQPVPFLPAVVRPAGCPSPSGAPVPGQSGRWWRFPGRCSSGASALRPQYDPVVP